MAMLHFSPWQMSWLMMFIVCSRFVQVTCEKLEEPKKGLIWNAVHKLGLEALQELLREVCSSQGGVCCLHRYQTDFASYHPCISSSLNAGVWGGMRDENLTNMAQIFGDLGSNEVLVCAPLNFDDGRL